jgi:hypothetical protein
MSNAMDALRTLSARITVLLALTIPLACSAADQAGTSVKIFAVLPDGTWREGSLNFGKHELRVSGAVKDALGVTGGEYTADGERDFSFACTVPIASGPLRSVVWKGTFQTGKDDAPGTAAGNISLLPRDPQARTVTLRFTSERPRPKRN